jgi:signal transduction histidine kinase
MLKEFFPSLVHVISRLKKYPQLWWTLFVALAITGGFIIVAQQFITIAQDAQESLINVRIGAIQDSLSEFVVLTDDSKEKIDGAISNLMSQNQTIKEFTFYIQKEDGLYVFTSSNQNLINTKISQNTLAGQLALNDPNNSYTLPVVTEDERLYQTYRAITQDGKVVGLIETIQTLSQADLLIEEKIRTGIIVFICILVAIMFLFFRHSRIIDYTTLYEELKQVDQLKDDFISMASHELKTPLAAIRGYSEFITEGEDVPKEYKEYSRRIDVSSKQLALLVEDMLDVSRIEQGRMQFKVERVLLPDFISQILPDFKALADAKKLSLTYSTHNLTHAYLQADITRLRQVLVNIVGNSIKYTNQGEVKISLTNTPDKKIEIRVSDTGIGMSEDERKNLFEKFYRIRNSETQEIKGTGLGLWITKQLIEKMGGTISVESIKGVGTHMSIRFNGEM